MGPFLDSRFDYNCILKCKTEYYVAFSSTLLKRSQYNGNKGEKKFTYLGSFQNCSSAERREVSSYI